MNRGPGFVLEVQGWSFHLSSGQSIVNKKYFFAYIRVLEMYLVVNKSTNLRVKLKLCEFALAICRSNSVV